MKSRETFENENKVNPPPAGRKTKSDEITVAEITKKIKEAEEESGDTKETDVEAFLPPQPFFLTYFSRPSDDEPTPNRRPIARKHLSLIRGGLDR